jgi:hypothetical protein
MVRRSVARDVPLDCVPHCSGLMERDIASELPRSTQVEYQKEVYSDAAGCAPSQVKEHRRLHPDIKITNDGRVVMTSHRQRQKVLKRLGMKDHDSYY